MELKRNGIVSSRKIVIKNIDDIYEHVGVGLYQIIIVTIGCIATLPLGMAEFLIFFLAFNPGWKCREESTECHLNGTVLSTDPHYRERCKMNRSEWMYPANHKFSTVTEFDWSCENENWIFVSTTLFYIGFGIGALLFGYLADRHGRKKVILFCVVASLLTSLLTSFALTVLEFQILRFFTALFLAGTYMIISVLSTEIVSESYRTTTGSVLWFTYSAGIALSGVIAYYVQEWRQLQIYCSAPFFILVPAIWMCPESFVWIHCRKKKEELTAEIYRIARINKRKPPSNIIFEWPEKDRKSNQFAFFLLFKPLKRLLMTLLMTWVWFVSCLVYTAIALAADGITGDAYRDFIIMALMDIPATIFTIYFTRRLGRRITAISSFFLSGLCLVVIGFIPMTADRTSGYAMGRLFLGIFGKVISCVSFCTIAVWGNELYPTHIRSNAVGLFQSTSVIGSILSPWIGIWLRRVSLAAPFVTMGVFLLVAAVSLAWVPETKGKQLPSLYTETEINGNIGNAEIGFDNVAEFPANVNTHA